MTDVVRPICLPDVTDFTRDTFEGKIATVSGWGYQSLDSGHESPLPKRLKKLDLDILGNKVISN